ncbi:MAG: hypothetical protein C0622_08595 [Desulfuromonas sp.]|nr:MAG: hypothetical protein C0622_08595 [Desulfuromonas sp.]
MPSALFTSDHNQNRSGMFQQRPAVILFCLAVILFFCSVLNTHAAVTSVTPITWNIIGLDSNSPAFGPNRFPVGARVCSDSAGSVLATFNWDSSNSYIGLSSSSPSSVTLDFSAADCLDAYFEVEVDRTAAAFDTTRQYHISAGGESTPIPRELYVEHLVSQGRNAITNLEYRPYVASPGTELAWTSVGAGSAFALVKGEIYELRMSSYTATQGYEQLESFSTLPNIIFQLLKVDTTYTADTSAYVSSPNDKLYADACSWENDPNSPIYLGCTDVGKAGGTLTVTYRVLIKDLPSGGTPIDLLSLIYDFSGSSFHYNSDYLVGGRSIIIVDPATATISKSFNPTPVNVSGISALTFTLSNPNGAVLNNVSFVDNLPSGMTVADPTGATTSGCGTPTFTPAIDDTTLSFSDGTIPAYGKCSVKVNVTVASAGTYDNDSENLFVGSTDTGDDATASLVADTTSYPPPSPPSSCPGQEVTLATWDFTNYSSGTTNIFSPTPSSGPVTGVTVSAAIVGASATGEIDASGSDASGTVLNANSWKTSGYTTASTATSSTQAYIDFDVDTTKYGGVGIWYDAYIKSGSWGGTNHLYLFSDESGTLTQQIDTTPLPTSWTSYAYSTASTNQNTKFRIIAAGAKTNSPSPLYLDNVIITGCLNPDPPTLAKAFSPNPVKVDGTSTLTFTLTNPNSGTDLSGVAFSDTLPTDVTVAAAPNASSTGCGSPTFAPSAGDGAISFTGGSIVTGGTCTVNVDVTVSSDGPHENISSIVTATESGPNNTATGIATASLIAVNPPSVSKQFAPNPILAGGTSTLTFTIVNPNPDNALSGIAFSDVLPTTPAAMVVAATPNAATSDCGSPTFSPAAGDGTLTFSGGTLAAGGICTVSVDITAPAIGEYANTSGTVAHTINSETVDGNTASDTLNVTAPHPAIALLKQVGASATGPWKSYLAVAEGDPVYYQLTIENAGDVPLSPVSVSDPDVSTASCSWPAPLPVADANDDDHIATCVVGPVSATAGTQINTATATGTYGGSDYSDSDSATYATTGLTLVKTATESTFSAAADVLHYSFVVTNSGNAPLAGPMTIDDDKATDESCPAVSTAVLAADDSAGDGDNYLDPGEKLTCSATYTVVTADVLAGKVTNIATASISGVTSPTATRTVPLDVVTLLFSKMATPVYDPINGTTNPKAIPGAYVDYTLQVSNTGGGSVDEDSLLISDPIPAATQLMVQGRIDTNQNSPVAFSDGDSDSGFVLTGTAPDLIPPFTLDYFTDAGCSTAALSLNPDADGFDPAIRCLRITMDGEMGGLDGTGNPADFSLIFRVRLE